MDIYACYSSLRVSFPAVHLETVPQEPLLNEGALQEYLRPARAGTVTEDDSRRVLGLQAADIAAAIASRTFEITAGSSSGHAPRLASNNEN